MVISPSMRHGLNVVALTKSNKTRLKQYEREILKDMLQAARNQPKLKTQEILEGKTITKIIKVRRICYCGDLLRRDQPHILNSALREMKKTADELYQLPETDTESSAPSEENEE
ncbi:hypothetical protein EVAR_21346_1 [Eumeta japonica]|uniref:Uncharacterized protein n=1 Tax=Eumeta variegata TaxID=151549 RepID=A0A4C1YEC1_EUMVA|nr:hypothetical protein EVAR_21346_1 [Eumeta japonica]